MLKRILRWLGVLLALGLVLSVLLTRRAVSEAESKYPPAGAFVRVDGVRLHYVRAGAGPAVVLLHGNPGSTDDWRQVIPPLAKDHLVIAFDRPGHGYSERGSDDPGSPKAQAALVHHALESLSIADPILVGHSWGGGLALAYALAFPSEIRAIVLVEGTAYADGFRPDPVYRILDTPILGSVFAWTFVQPVGRPMVAGGLEKAFSPFPVPKDYLARAEAMWTRPSEARATAQDSLRRIEVTPALADAYPQIRAPIVLIAAQKDLLTPSEGQAIRLRRVLPRSNLILLPDAGHMLAETNPDAVIDAVRTATLATDLAAP